MGETDGSSNAARRALSLDDTHQKTGFFGRIVEALTPSDDPDKGQANGQAVPSVMSHSILNLRRMRVEDVAIPKADLVAVPNTVSKKELVAVFRDSGLSRIPVYEGTLDSPLGFVHLKDFALNYGFNGNTADLDLPPLLRPLLFVPPSMQIGVLLAKMQTERRHIALVIDEYGGVDGLVTIEDLIEQVVGEIEDEHDTDEDQPWVLEKPGCYVALAKTPLDEFEVEIGLSLTAHEDIDEEEIDTLGGLVSLLSGRVPARGEVVVHPDGTEFEIIDADPRRIKRLRVRLSDTAK
ncbi:MAG: CBS domain-containing protein [Rhodobacteraceae bacterium]|nr:CBS domain-containing protein [Paracoccaceae bacterium]